MGIVIPRRSAAKIQEEADEIWSGNTEKVADTMIESLTVRGVLLKSRYRKAADFERMITIVLELSAQACASIETLFCDSKVGNGYAAIVGSRVDDERAARTLVDELDRAACRPVSGGGHNGISVEVRVGRHRTETELLAFVPPNWPSIAAE